MELALTCVPSELNNALKKKVDLEDSEIYHHLRDVMPPPPRARSSNSLSLLSLPARGIGTSQFLLRKEVIQPHLPIRLPCYDFTPITKPTFGRALLFRLGYGLRVFPALMV